MLDISGIKSSNTMEGISFFNKNFREYIFAATDRFDESVDQRRCVRTKKFKLILNLDTSSSVGKENNYRKQMKTMQVLDSLNDNNLISGYFKNGTIPQKTNMNFMIFQRIHLN